MWSLQARSPRLHEQPCTCNLTRCVSSLLFQQVGGHMPLLRGTSPNGMPSGWLCKPAFPSEVRVYELLRWAYVINPFSYAWAGLLLNQFEVWIWVMLLLRLSVRTTPSDSLVHLVQGTPGYYFITMIKIPEPALDFGRCCLVVLAWAIGVR